ncbi:MAG: cupin-like domain-containing protein, partial [Polyangiaceae bacterium]
DPTAIRRALIEKGVPSELAAREIATIADAPLLSAGRAQARQSEKLGMVLRLRRELAALSSHPTAIERRPTIEPDEFFERYYCTNTPLVLTEMTRDWPALSRWGVDDLRERFGNAEIEICSGREGDPTPDKNFEQHLEQTTVTELLRRIETTTGASNDDYLIAHNRALERSALGALLDDVVVPDFIEPEHHKGSASLWIGPAGSITPMHHDKCNILFCQIVGRKHFRIIEPGHIELLDRPDGFYCTLGDDELATLPAKEVVLEPGMTLFLPVGWWHDVRALDFSMSVSLLNFRRRLDADWYAPGQVP